MARKILFTSVCRPLGPKHGDGPSVGYELLHGQVTRAQGLFSPRSLHLHFSLEYIAENLETPCTVLHYPTRRELIRELKKGYDFVGISFLLAVFHRVKELVALIREYAPSAKIILGGYGTVLPDEVLRPLADHICREEGVGFMRRLLGEPELKPPFRHPLMVSNLRVFSLPVSRTGMIFAGLGCPNGCDFCCTSHFFRRRHIKLLPTGRDIYAVVERYLKLDPNMPFVILDEDFLLNRRRAMEFRDCVLRGGKPISVFVFSSLRAISQYTVEEILEMGIDGFWIGYEGARAGFAKQQGRPAGEVFREFREHGIAILASMIVGLPYQDEATVKTELQDLLRLAPTLCQFLIYGPTPGTPLFEQVMRERTLRDDLAADPELYYRNCHGFSAMVKHPHLTAEAIERLQQTCFDEDFQSLGPSIFRTVESWLLGYRKLKDSANPFLRAKAAWLAREARKAYPVFLAGRLLGPNPGIRRWISELEESLHRELGKPSLMERLQSVPAMAMALVSGLRLKLDLFQHPRLVRHVYRMPAEAKRPGRIWRRLGQLDFPVAVELRPYGTVWLRPERALGSSEFGELVTRVRVALQRTRDRLIIDLKSFPHLEDEAARRLVEALERFRSRIRLLLPSAVTTAQLLSCLEIFAIET
ncbi:MAG: cobalamin-dependent protein [Planctomycetota bacterium]